jgi:hypothetical protein
VAVPSLILLAALVVAAVSLGRARLAIGSVRGPVFAASRGSAATGVRYAFTTAFLPWAKESGRHHLATYLAGITFHAGIFAMLARLVLTLVPIVPPRPVEQALAVLFAAALAAGLGLLVRRRRDPELRAISVPDDLVANLMVDVALGAALAATLAPAALPLFQIAGAALLLYAPLGKLRHMLFLLTSRAVTGRAYGRRGVFP